MINNRPAAFKYGFFQGFMGSTRNERLVLLNEIEFYFRLFLILKIELRRRFRRQSFNFSSRCCRF
ncbi:hypothetical protein D3C87_1888130 [compost metagenome]